MTHEEINQLILFGEYDQKTLAELWGYKSYDAIRRAVVTPAESNIIILFLTEGYNHLEGDRLKMLGEAKHVNDSRIEGNISYPKDSIFLFYREDKRKKYTFYGEIKIKKADIQTEKASTFLFEVTSLKEIGRQNYYVVKTSDCNAVKDFENGHTSFCLKGLNSYEDSNDIIKPGDPIFLVFGGNNVYWTLGLVAVLKAKSGPVRDNNSERNYMINAEMVAKIVPTMTKEDFIPYKDSYNSFIGPSTKGSRNQALYMISEAQVIGVLRGVLDTHPELEESISALFSKTIIQKVKLPMTVYLPSVKSYGELSETIIQRTDDSTGENIIFYGVPGCGKSFIIKEKYCNDDEFMERVVFHPDYSYSDFVGQILPKTDSDTHQIRYDFVDGPFTAILKKAWEHPENHYYLIIEEINRGNAPAIFGDIFQLLDRGKDGESVYGVTNSNVLKSGKVKIPGNLSLLATMNTADQSVFTLDTAFKRRWKMKLVPNSFDQCSFSEMKILDTNIKWKSFVTTINEIILNENSDLAVNEDKRIGAFFVSEDDLKLINGKYNPAFAEKVIMYLWNDVFKYNKEKIFDEKYNSLEKIIAGFEKEKFNVFKIDFNESDDTHEE